MSSRPPALLRLLERGSSRTAVSQTGAGFGLVKTPPFPGLAIVDQPEVKLMPLLVLINPWVCGTLLIGLRGTGMTVAICSPTGLLRKFSRSLFPCGRTGDEAEARGRCHRLPDQCLEIWTRRTSFRVRPGAFVRDSAHSPAGLCSRVIQSANRNRIAAGPVRAG